MASVSILAKLILAQQFFVEKSCTEFQGNPRDDLVADTRSHTDGRMGGWIWSQCEARLVNL